ncbi:hypothetical protein CLAFUW4_07417 [Fulvia fulva]|uniref:Uncharacterized protein n=1 Tax=Passalora fulva TaxID=5499 RepID=A0A9Q8PB12_PASFU|nr:uncharacterized protein CLAFUR5_07547 [Fulvia fulva]KAK4621850.1 hypothetical protein CLAFUR4_07424 [Fulvia fulva]KAK4622748.1 hypothetical protein CLAFUR0_07423 [Fulvia fulva]UJO19176.1 hypothetical protein CLAFUR5_07547 [Fulvia fulva]WPV15995.1 hypothetical protein CLAFUW4_07417 [Fulvia fulva]WPV30838.1 hypothetical protein CLAFUW7_07420 [Fulvia fulva]
MPSLYDIETSVAASPYSIAARQPELAVEDRPYSKSYGEQLVPGSYFIAADDVARGYDVTQDEIHTTPLWSAVSSRTTTTTEQSGEPSIRSPHLVPTNEVAPGYDVDHQERRTSPLWPVVNSRTTTTKRSREPLVRSPYFAPTGEDNTEPESGDEPEVVREHGDQNEDDDEINTLTAETEARYVVSAAFLSDRERGDVYIVTAVHN